MKSGICRLVYISRGFHLHTTQVNVKSNCGCIRKKKQTVSLAQRNGTCDFRFQDLTLNNLSKWNKPGTGTYLHLLETVQVHHAGKGSHHQITSLS